MFVQSYHAEIVTDGSFLPNKDHCIGNLPATCQYQYTGLTLRVFLLRGPYFFRVTLGEKIISYFQALYVVHLFIAIIIQCMALYT